MVSDTCNPTTASASVALIRYAAAADASVLFGDEKFNFEVFVTFANY